MKPMTRLTPRLKEKFLELYRTTRSVTRAYTAVGVSRNTVYDHANPDSPRYDEKFHEQWEQVTAEIEEEVLTSALEKAVEGWEEPVFFQGERTDTVVKKSDYLHGILLKGFHKDRLAERNELTGANGGAIRMNNVTQGSLNKKLDGIAKRLGVEVEEPPLEEEPPAKKKVVKKKVAKKKIAKKKAVRKKVARKTKR